ncbi:MAG: hypothetical protein ACLPQ6_12205 [Steroidobacteraceae bacterium]
MATPAEAAKPKAAETEGTQTLELMDPELLLAAAAAPVAAQPEASEDHPQVLEVDPGAPLVLEDSLEVDKMLSTPASAKPAAPAPAAAKSADDSMLTLSLEEPAARAAKPAAAAPARPASPASVKTASAAIPAAEPTPAEPALVPLARRASLSAAASKLAAASGTAPTRNPPVKLAKPAAAAPAGKPAAAPAAASAVVKPITAKGQTAPPDKAAAAPATPAAGTTTPADAPSLASWANARAAAASSRTATPPASPSAPAVKPVQPGVPEKTRSATPAATPAAAAAAGATVLPSRGMDRDFIARNQVVERYLSGKLPIKAATDFERYCKDHPELLDEMGLPERVNAGLRLLEASGKPEPWQEASHPLWQQPAVTIGSAALAALLALVLAVVAASSAGKTHKILDLQRQVSERTLDPAASTRVIRLLPNRSSATNTPAIVVGGGAEAMLADLRIDESRSPYREFRVTIDRIDQGRVMVIDNLTKDSNGHLRIALNSSALGPGNYLFTIEGLTMRLEPQPDSWVTVGIAQR